MTAIEPTHLSWPFFDPRHRDLAQRFGVWASANLTPFERDEGGDGKAARAIFERLATGPWLACTLPREAETGAAIDLRSVCLLREICAYGSAIADVALSEPWLAILPIALYGSQAQRDVYVKGYLAGQLMPAFALSEPDAGSDAAAITATARRDGDHYVIDGRKTWTSNSNLADAYVVFARTNEREGAGGISAFVLDRADDGIVFEERLHVLPPHTVGTWRMTDCRVPLDRLIGSTGQGFGIAMAALELFRPTVGAAAVGFARRGLDEALRRSVTRVAFKKPIAEHQLVQAKLADMAVKVDASALLVYRAAWQHDTGEGPIAREAAIAKLFATEAAHEVVDQAVQIFGGQGLLKGTAVERLYRHARAFRIFDGTSEIQQLIIAREILRTVGSRSPGRD